MLSPNKTAELWDIADAHKKNAGLWMDVHPDVLQNRIMTAAPWFILQPHSFIVMLPQWTKFILFNKSRTTRMAFYDVINTTEVMYFSSTDKVEF